MSYESAFVSRATAKAIARLYQAEGNDSFIYKAGDRKDPKSGVSKPWFKVELGRPGALDSQLPGIEWYPSAGTRPARAEELPTPLRRGPAGEYLPVERVEIKHGEKSGAKYGAMHYDSREKEILEAVDRELSRVEAFHQAQGTLEAFLQNHCGLDALRQDIDIADDGGATTTCRMLAEVRVVLRKMPREIYEEVDWFDRIFEAASSGSVSPEKLGPGPV